MAVKKLTNGGSKYAGKFVATRSFNDKNVVASGNDAKGVISRASQKCKSPVIFFVPSKDALHIY